MNKSMLSNHENFSPKQVFTLVFGIVAGIAFLETSAPIVSSVFWRDFLLKLVVYGAAAEVVAILLAQSNNFNQQKHL